MTTKINGLSVIGSALGILLLLTACGNQQPSRTQTTAQVETPPPSAPGDSKAPPAELGPDDQLTAQLNELGAVEKRAGWIVDLNSADFKPGQTSFDPSDSARIDRIAQLMKDRPGVKLLVRGYTDSRGSKSLNTQLSQERADAVRSTLVQRGSDAGRIRAEGRGEEAPVASNDTAEGREANRRVEIVFSDAEGLFASASIG